MRLTLIAMACTSLAAAQTDDTWLTYGHLAKRIEAIAPTPTGTGHLGQLGSGSSVHIRFPLPKTRPAGFWVVLSNIVGYSGRGGPTDWYCGWTRKPGRLPTRALR